MNLRTALSTSHLVASNAVSNALNYAFQIIVARLLAPEQFASLQTLLAAYMILSVPLSTITMHVTAHFASGSFNQRSNRRETYSLKLISQAVCFGAALCLVAYLLNDEVAAILNIPANISIVLFASSIAANIFYQIALGIAQGFQKWAWVSSSFVVIAALKIALTYIFLAFSAGVNSVLTALLFASIGTAFFLYAGSSPQPRTTTAPQQSVVDEGAPRTMFLAVLAANAAFAMLTQFDMIAVNRNTSSEIAAGYGASMVLGKLLLYIPSALTIPLLATVSRFRSTGMRTFPLLARSSLVCIGLVFTGLLAIIPFYEFWMTALYRSKYSTTFQHVALLCLAFSTFPFLALLINYAVAIRHSTYLMIVSAGGAAVYASLVSLRLDIDAMLTILFGAGLALCLVGYSLFLVCDRRRN